MGILSCFLHHRKPVSRAFDFEFASHTSALCNVCALAAGDYMSSAQTYVGCTNNECPTTLYVISFQVAWDVSFEWGVRPRECP